jgi:CBS domain-containing protein
LVSKPQASVQDGAKILHSNRISALPVVNELGELVGIISEGDLVRRADLGTNYRRGGNVFWEQDLAKEYLKSP